MDWPTAAMGWGHRYAGMGAHQGKRQGRGSPLSPSSGKSRGAAKPRSLRWTRAEQEGTQTRGASSGLGNKTGFPSPLPQGCGCLSPPGLMGDHSRRQNQTPEHGAMPRLERAAGTLSLAVSPDSTVSYLITLSNIFGYHLYHST